MNELKESDPGAFINEVDEKQPIIVRPTNGGQPPISNDLETKILNSLRGGM